MATSVTVYVLLIQGSGVARSWCARSSCVTCGGIWSLGLWRAWTWSGSVIRLGVMSSCTLGVGTIGVGTLGVNCVVTLGIGLVRSSVVAFCGAIDSKIAANFSIACIISMPVCLNGVVGAGLFKAWARSNAAIVAASALESPGTLQCWGRNPPCCLSFCAQLWNNIPDVPGSDPLLGLHTTC
jgi:hypothetical protein